MTERRFDDGTPLARDKGVHYSEKGGHGERSAFWRKIRRIMSPDLQWAARRYARRIPQDGRY